MGGEKGGERSVELSLLSMLFVVGESDESSCRICTSTIDELNVFALFCGMAIDGEGIDNF